jgi:hypothetical protein
MTRKATETPDSTGTEVEIHEENEGWVNN